MRKSFFTGKRVLITGHTGFKGSWLCHILIMLGADVYGYSLGNLPQPNLFDISGVCEHMVSYQGDVREFERLYGVMKEVKPEIVFHMAAQPIVNISFEQPVYTYDVNVMGTVNVLECIRRCDSVKSFINVTTDKVYLNREWTWGYRENEELKGLDPYSNSKSCTELVTYSYINTFFKDTDIAISTVRAGNVIGGGDFAPDRIIPDCVRAALFSNDILIRNRQSIRPYQHVLEPLFAYLLIAEKQYENKVYADAYNIGPQIDDCVSTGDIVELFCREWKLNTNRELKWSCQEETKGREANVLKLDCSKMKEVFGWKPYWKMEKTLQKIVEWTIVYADHGDIVQCMENQIREYMKVFERDFTI